MARPSLCHHKTLELGYVWRGKRQIYFSGKWPKNQAKAPKEIEDQYERLLANLLTGKEIKAGLNPDPTVGEVISLYTDDLPRLYPQGTEAKSIKIALRFLDDIFSEEPLNTIGPKKFRDVQEAMVKANLTRQGINKYSSRILRFFAWAVGEEYIQETQYRGLKLNAFIKRGKTVAKEVVKKGKVSNELFLQTIKVCPPMLAAMLWIQRLTGMRPGELVRMSPDQIDNRDPECWFYRPVNHKLSHRGLSREIALSQDCIKILNQWMPEKMNQPFFVHRLGTGYKTNGYTHLLQRILRKHKMTVWSPNQIRKAAAQDIYRELGKDFARSLMGHIGEETTEEYYLEHERELSKKAAIKLIETKPVEILQIEEKKSQNEEGPDLEKK